MAYPYYNNFNSYQQLYNPVQDQLQQLRNQPQQMTTQVQPDDRIFVQGELAAQAYLVAPNSFVRLWDSTRNVFYEKRADQTGRPYMEAYEYNKKVSEVTGNGSEQIDYEEKIKSLEKRIMALEKMKGDVLNESKSTSDDADV